MEGKEVDLIDGGVVDDGLKSTAVPGPDQSSAEVERLKNHLKTLLAENKKTKEERDALRAAKQALDEAEAKKRGDYEELLKKKDNDLNSALGQIKKLTIANKAENMGLMDPDYVEILSKKIGDDFANLDEVFSELKTQKPFLFRDATPPPPPGTDKRKSPALSIGEQWTEARIASLSKEDFEKHKSEIVNAMLQGAVK